MNTYKTSTRVSDSQVRVECAYCRDEFYVPTWIAARRETQFCDRMCMGLYQSEFRVGKNAPRWKGGSYTRKQDGRVYLYKPEHPAAHTNGYVPRYRIVAEEKIGRPLRPNEEVHHRDGDCTNDAPENLQVLTKSAHAALHARLRREEKIKHEDAADECSVADGEQAA